METSDANAAYQPSKPSIPTPMEDSSIIPTSLPPSPIEHTILSWLFTSLVKMDFCFGSHLQTITLFDYKVV